jgi:hypothetical protein
MTSRLVSAALLLWCLAGCTSISEQTSADFKPPAGKYKVIVMRPDIAVSVLTAGGQLEQREDWTNTAREHVLDSLRAQQAGRGGSADIVLASAQSGTSDPTLLELDRLHEAVGQSILIHKYTSHQDLPTKKHVFDWTLGDLAVNFGKSSGYDYALFFYARDSFSSGGRVTLQAIGYLSCIVGVCVAPSGGQQLAFVSLVDLKTGNVVWFSHLTSPKGDIRTAEGATDLVNKLLNRMNGDFATMKPAGG